MTETETEEIPFKYKRKHFSWKEGNWGSTDSGTGHPVSLWSLHAWRYAKSERTWLWGNSSSWCTILWLRETSFWKCKWTIKSKILENKYTLKEVRYKLSICKFYAKEGVMPTETVMGYSALSVQRTECVYPVRVLVRVSLQTSIFWWHSHICHKEPHQLGCHVIRGRVGPAWFCWFPSKPEFMDHLVTNSLIAQCRLDQNATVGHMHQ